MEYSRLAHAISVRYPAFDPRKHGHELCSKLRALNGAPEFVYGNGGAVSIFALWWESYTDERVMSAFQLLRDHGYRMLDGDERNVSEQEYRIEIANGPRKKVLDASDWLDMSVKGMLWEGSYGGDRVARVVWPQKVTQKAHKCDAGPIVVSNAFKQELEAIGIVGLLFEMTTTVEDLRALACDGPVTTWRQRQLEPWWVLTSASMLPRPICKLVDIDGNEFRDGDYSKFCFVSNGVYERGFLRYLRAQVEPFAGQDAVITRETFGLNKERGGHSLIVSQRFRTLSMERKWPFVFDAVIVEEADGTRKPDLPVETPPEFRRFMEPV